LTVIYVAFNKKKILEFNNKPEHLVTKKILFWSPKSAAFADFLRRKFQPLYVFFALKPISLLTDLIAEIKDIKRFRKLQRFNG